MACLSYNASFLIRHLQLLECLVSAVQIVATETTIIPVASCFDLATISLICKLSWVCPLERISIGDQSIFLGISYLICNQVRWFSIWKLV